jgi:hypothetical protein
MVIFQLDVVHNWSNQLPQKLVDEKLFHSIAQRSPLSSMSHKMAWATRGGRKGRAYGWLLLLDGGQQMRGSMDVRIGRSQPLVANDQDRGRIPLVVCRLGW